MSNEQIVLIFLGLVTIVFIVPSFLSAWFKWLQVKILFKLGLVAIVVILFICYKNGHIPSFNLKHMLASLHAP